MAWTAIVALFLQLLLTSAHFPFNGEGPSALSMPLCSASATEHQDTAAPPLHGRQPLGHTECPICRTAPIVSASLAPVIIALPPVALGSERPLPPARLDAKRISTSRSAQPRAPPVRV